MKRKAWKRNRKLIVILSLLVLGSGFLAYLKFYYPNNRDTALQRLKILLFDENVITVKGDGVKISDDKIKVTWHSDFIEEKTIWENGRQVGRIESEYGPQGFNVYYHNKLIGGVGHMKTNNWHTHSYSIELHYLDANHTISFDFSAIGHDQLIKKNIRKNIK